MWFKKGQQAMNKLFIKVFEKIKRVIDKINKVCLVIMIAAFTMFFNTPAFAADFETSIFATGTKSLITDIGKWLLILAPIVGTLVSVYFFIRRGAADEMDSSAATRCC